MKFSIKKVFKNDFALTFLARSIQSVSNLLFIITSTFVLPIEEFSNFVPFAVCIGLIIPFFNNGSSDYYQKFEVKKNVHFNFFAVIFVVLSFFSFFLLLFANLISDEGVFITFILIILFIFFEISSRLYSDIKLKENEVKFLEKTILYSALISFFLSFVLLFIMKNWLVLALKPIIFSFLKTLMFRAHKRYNFKFEFNLWKTITVDYLSKIKQLFIFNILSSFVENIDKLIFPFYRSDSVIGNVERLSTFSRLSDSTFRLPVYRLMISLNLTKAKWQRYSKLIFIPILTISCFFLLIIFYFKNPQVNLNLMFGYLFFGIGWFLRGIFFAETLYFYESGRLSLRIMIIYITFITFIYITCFYCKLDFNFTQLVIGVSTLCFWSLSLAFHEKINSL